MKHRKDVMEDFYKKYVAEKYEGIPNNLGRRSGAATNILLEAYETIEPGTAVRLNPLDGIKPAAFTSAIYSLSKKKLIDKTKFWVRTTKGKNVYLVKLK